MFSKLYLKYTIILFCLLFLPVSIWKVSRLPILAAEKNVITWTEDQLTIALSPSENLVRSVYFSSSQSLNEVSVDPDQQVGQFLQTYLTPVDSGKIPSLPAGKKIEVILSISIPEKAKAGMYKGWVSISTAGKAVPRQLSITIIVKDPVSRAAGSTNTKILWPEGDLSLALAPGANELISTSFTTTQTIQNVVVRASLPIRPFIQITPYIISSINQRQQLLLTFSIPSGTAFGTYQGNIQVLSNNTPLFNVLNVTITVTEEDQPDVTSPAIVSINGVSENTFNSLSSTIQFTITEAQLHSDPNYISVLNNEQPIPASNISVSGNVITVSSSLQDGKNHFILVAEDTNEVPIDYETVVWGGNFNYAISVIDQLGLPVTGALITVNLSEDKEIFTLATSLNGQVSFNNLPSDSLVITAHSGDRIASVNTKSLGGSFGTISLQLKLSSFKPSSNVANNDFSLGLVGWETGNAPVELIEHINDSDGDDGGTSFSSEQTQNLDYDLFLKTPVTQDRSQDLFEPQLITRTFQTSPGTKNVTVRYKFVTNDHPCDNVPCSTNLPHNVTNDRFSVTLRSKNQGSVASDAASLRSLDMHGTSYHPSSEFGYDSLFYASTGAYTTVWKELSIPVDEGGDTVQIEAIVENVALQEITDIIFGAYIGWSGIVIDQIQERQLEIANLDLRDIDNTRLDFLSVAAHTYFNGNTRIHGSVTVRGAANDSLTSLTLQVLHNGRVVATATLAAEARDALIRQFGASEQVQITNPQLLFQLPSAQAALVPAAQNGTVRLRVRARSATGRIATREFSRGISKLVRYTNRNRYGQRDPNAGGDDWVKPSVKPAVEHFVNRTWGDFSNMNGGRFRPHTTHRTGNDIDGHFDGYNARNAVTAQRIIANLNDDTFGSRISIVYVTFRAVDNDPFWLAIKDVQLDDGRIANDVIRPIGGHTTHFHYRIRDR